ncbi:unnamed protein product [Candidula unifasciata]|uniref:Protein kinase domain-containing protein n=1 Tax=Candidula unifasciata TaxID=100452 RepID=A0A8S3ZCG0_9EUPU|nr:unnamed protein product [Candidula unifasciata]
MELPVVKPSLVTIAGDFFTTYRFLLGPVLGSGMSGEVVLATSLLSSKHKRAVKILSLLTADGGARNKKLFDREVGILRGLSHPHVIKHTISVRCPEYLAICTHYCPNGTLTSKLDTMTSELCNKYFIQLTCAVRYLNDKQRVVHCDIKPDNIFINENNDPVLGDFGISMSLPPGAKIVFAKDIGGTRRYRAPELKCRMFVDPCKVDVYSLGVVLWCMMFQSKPTSDTVYECLDDVDMLMAAPEPQGWCLANSVQYDPDIRRTAASILANMHEADIHRDLIDSL